MTVAHTCRVEISITVRPTDAANKQVVHSWYFATAASTLTAADYTSLAQGVSSILMNPGGTGAYPFIMYQGRAATIKVYDMADLKPRPERAVVTYTPSVQESAALGPRRVALCLSYFAGRNVKRQRGRTYMGPWILSVLAERPDTTTLNRFITLATNLANFGTNAAVSQSWSQFLYSPTTATYWYLDHWWVHDVWASVENRDDPEMTRLHYP